jgi:hypothetical protein
MHSSYMVCARKVRQHDTTRKLLRLKNYENQRYWHGVKKHDYSIHQNVIQCLHNPAAGYPLCSRAVSQRMVWFDQDLRERIP